MDERLRLASVIGASLPRYCEEHPLNPRQWQVCHHILTCRTEALGETLTRCDHCGHEAHFYRACRDRHCPRCQRQAARAWCERQRAHTLEVPYYHVVFTLPQSLNPWAECHPEVIYDQLLTSTWETLKRFAADPKRLNGQLGATLVLHTWGQTLVRHPHVHCLVPGGALSAQGTWKAARSTYLFPVRALSRYFRGHFVRRLRERARQGELSRIQDPKAVEAMLDALMGQDWVVYSKPTLAHTDTVVAYLARYSHRIALTEGRLLDFHEGQVRLRYKDYRDHYRDKVLTLSAEELIRRFLLHVLPKGFMRIRHCGFLANRCREAKLAQIRQALGQAQAQAQETEPRAGEHDPYRCPHCGQGRLHIIARLMPSAKLTGRHDPPRSPAAMH
jgi:hypothetical protein